MTYSERFRETRMNADLTDFRRFFHGATFFSESRSATADKFAGL